MPSTPQRAAGQDARPLLQIGEVAERVGLSLRTVRFYEEAGLVTPAGRTDGGFRLYAEAQIARLELIKYMKPLGFALEQMRELLIATDTLADPAATRQARAAARERVRAFATLATDRCADLHEQLRRGEAFAAQLRRTAR